MLLDIMEQFFDFGQETLFYLLQRSEISLRHVYSTIDRVLARELSKEADTYHLEH